MAGSPDLAVPPCSPQTPGEGTGPTCVSFWRFEIWETNLASQRGGDP